MTWTARFRNDGWEFNRVAAEIPEEGEGGAGSILFSGMVWGILGFEITVESE